MATNKSDNEDIRLSVLISKPITSKMEPESGARLELSNKPREEFYSPVKIAVPFVSLRSLMRFMRGAWRASDRCFICHDHVTVVANSLKNLVPFQVYLTAMHNVVLGTLPPEANNESWKIMQTNTGQKLCSKHATSPAIDPGAQGRFCIGQTRTANCHKQLSACQRFALCCDLRVSSLVLPAGSAGVLCRCKAMLLTACLAKTHLLQLPQRPSAKRWDSHRKHG